LTREQQVLLSGSRQCIGANLLPEPYPGQSDRLFLGSFCPQASSCMWQATSVFPSVIPFQILLPFWRDVNCKRVGKGPEAIKYLSRYIYRVAITNNRILSLIDGEVTFLYRPVDSDDWKTMKLPVLVFMARFLACIAQGLLQGEILRIPASEM